MDVKEIKKCITCIILNENRDSILVLEHKKCKNKLSLPAGTVEPDEIIDTRLTAVREMEEELCIYININDLSLFDSGLSYYDRIDGHKIYHEDCYYVEDFAGEIENNEPMKHPRLFFMPLTEAFNSPEKFTYQTWKIISKLYGHMNNE